MVFIGILNCMTSAKRFRWRFDCLVFVMNPCPLEVFGPYFSSSFGLAFAI